MLSFLQVVRVPGVEPGSMASEATTLSIVLHSQTTGRPAFAGGAGVQAVLIQGVFNTEDAELAEEAKKSPAGGAQACLRDLCELRV